MERGNAPEKEKIVPNQAVAGGETAQKPALSIDELKGSWSGTERGGQL